MNILFLLCAASTLALPIQFSLIGDTPTIRMVSSDSSKSSSNLSPDQQYHNTAKPNFQDFVQRLRLGRPPSAKGTSPDVKSPAGSESHDDEGTFSGRKYGVLLGTPSKPTTGQTPQASPSSAGSKHYGSFLGKANKFVELQGPRLHHDESKPSKVDKEPDSSLGRLYGTFLGEMDNLMPSESHPKNALAKSYKKASCDSSKRIATYFKPSEFIDLLDTHGPECVAIAVFILFPLAYLVLELLEMALRKLTRERYPQRGRDRVRLTGPEKQLRA